MRHYLKLIVIGSVFVSLTGCLDFNIYESTVPLDPAKKALLDPALPGRWQQLPNKDGGTDIGVLEILPFNDREYLVKSPQDKGCEVSRAYVTKVGSQGFINLQGLEEKQKKFSFARYTFNPEGHLVLEIVSDELLKTPIDSSKKLYRLIKKNLDNPKLSHPELTFRFTRQSSQE